MNFNRNSDLFSISVATVLVTLLDYFYLNETIGYFSKALFVETSTDKAIIFILIYLCMNFGVAVLLTTRHIRFPFFILSLLLVAMGKIYMGINAEEFGILDIETALKYLDFASQAASTYWKVSLKALLLAIPYSIMFLLLRAKLKPVSIKYLPLILVGLFSGAYLTARSAGAHTRAFPRYIQPLFVGGYYLSTSPYVGPRDEIYFKPTTPTKARHVIFIMDESVRGDLLSLNGYEVETTPYLKEKVKEAKEIFNFGIASSMSNSSSSSNYSVLTGIKMSELPDRAQRSRHLPLIFSYAHKSVAKVNFIWAQTSFVAQRKKFDFLTENVVDLVTQFPNLPIHEYDRKVVDELDKITASDETSFTWVNKWGSHFDYDWTYPPNGTIFNPIYRDSASDDQKALYNSYYNSLRWGVDEFFKELLTRLKNRDVLIVYSSDHGQSILEAGIPGTHNRTFNISPSQASVPILAAGLNTSSVNFLKENYNVQNLNETSAEQIFPTLLFMMGFDKSDIEKHYARTLFDSVNPARSFLSGDMWGLGPAVSNVFDLKKLTQTPSR